ncbi:MAG: queuosine precursor transporter [Gammaproteobacteria bacterium]|nr:queuosine precursor transporter [Gammaproteobacteria bacterium]
MIAARSPKIIPYKYILYISMLFITIDLSAVSVAYKMVTLNNLFEINSAATLIFPLTYCIGDIVTEVYGYNMAKALIWYSLLLQIIFGLLTTAVIHLPSPLFWSNDPAYNTVFGSILRFIFAGTIANFSSSIINIYIVSKLKIPFEGKLFWLRSILSTIVGGFIMVAIIMVGFVGKDINHLQIWIMFKSTFSLEILYAFALALPASLIAKFLKIHEAVDVYDTETNYNPFNFK